MPFTSPAAGIWGPKVMIINEMAGSGGDLMPCVPPDDAGPLTVRFNPRLLGAGDEVIHPLDAVVDTGLQFGPQL